jgi:peptidoglycan/LPS O-acetylase OafA/YrhL
MTNPWWFVTYLQNWKPEGSPGDKYLDHLWSLAIEEQFYLVWPALVWLVPRRRLSWVCAAVVAGAFALRCWMSISGVAGLRIYSTTPCRLDCLATGAFLAVGIRDFPAQLERWTPWVRRGCAALFAVVAALCPGPVWTDRPMQTVGASLLALGFGSMVYGAATSQRGWLHIAFSNRWLRQFGKYSYGMYVLHSAPWEVTAFRVRELGGSLVIVKYLYLPAFVTVSFALAWLSFRYLEQPFLALKTRVPYTAQHAHVAPVCDAVVTP